MKSICISCLKDALLAAAVVTDAQEGKCEYCQSLAQCVSIASVSQEVDAIVSSRFHLTAREPHGLDYLRVKEEGIYWERDGEHPTSVVERVACVPWHAAEDIRKLLKESIYIDPKDDPDGENRYSNEARLEEDAPPIEGFVEDWDSFVRHVQRRSRFFSHETTKTLDAVFADLGTHRTPRGKGVLRAFRPRRRASIYRARVAFSDEEIKKILSRPELELGPPPSNVVRPGRMNANGISVFYGALDEKTCIAEVRPPVGSHVVVAQFVVRRALRVLDLDAMQKVFADPSHFDPRYSEHVARAAFLRRFAGMISRPVMPMDEEREYLPTQVIAEYLAEAATPSIDGMIYRSVQREHAGKNIVLFNQARHVLPRRPDPTQTIEVDLGWESEDDFDDDITIFVERRAEYSGPSREAVEQNENEDVHAWTLELDRKSIRVHEVSASTVRTRTRSVSWHEFDPDAIPF